jgi:hypothetical protein
MFSLEFWIYLGYSAARFAHEKIQEAHIMTSKMLKNLKCPTCRKSAPWEGNPFRPFCSERCKMIDLGAWASEEFRIPADQKPDDEEPEER